ncbi:DUF3597 domain-containing protein [Shinella pollutisoli]|uniref:DUF3597 domain-containing protein n=1 Tax=Shinella pollutisoli TaxID=2250594 RepID=A0ABV7DF50_9HYPH|nr:DUF3597 domain-containing protein [Shinella pollutisoli]
MGIFSSIKNAIFGQAKAAPASAEAGEAAAATPVTPVTEKKAEAAAPAAEAKSANTGGAAASAVDVAAILDAAVKASGQKLDWKHSIVDLMKALKLDSSLGARKELAAELGYTGDTSDSATMNVWLHKQVIRKLSENGGKVPADLLD